MSNSNNQLEEQEYIDLIRINDRNYLITKSIQEKGLNIIKVNEIIQDICYYVFLLPPKSSFILFYAIILNSDGDLPVTFLNIRVKCWGYSNPRFRAISETGKSVPSNASFAKLISLF